MKTVPFDRATYIERRRVLKEKMQSGKILLLGNSEASMNYKDNHYPFRQDSTFLYYFGLDMPGLIAIIDVDHDRDIIFGEELTMDDIIWTGPQPSLSSLAEEVGVTEVLSRAAIINFINADIHFLPPYRADHTILIADLIGKKVRKVQKRVSQKLINAVISQREIKSKEEVVQMHEASEISHKMHIAVMEAAKPGMMEHDLVGVASKVLYEHDVMFSYPPILTINGQTLHNHGHHNQLTSGKLVLFDGGGESHGHYAGDITRTFPVDKKFSSQQKELYAIVHNMYTAAVDMLAPGVRYWDVHARTAKILVEGLSQIGLVRGDVDQAFASDVHTMFFPHGLGHMIGLDVHDMENLGENHVGYGSELQKSTAFGWRSLRLGKELHEGFALTVEPGLYMIPELIDKCKADGLYKDFLNHDALDSWRNVGGIRLEDDYVITSIGSTLLGMDIAKSADEIEEVRSRAF